MNIVSWLRVAYNELQVEDGGADNEWSNFCRDAFMDNFAFANRTVSMLLGCEEVPSASSRHACWTSAPL